MWSPHQCLICLAGVEAYAKLQFRDKALFNVFSKAIQRRHSWVILPQWMDGKTWSWFFPTSSCLMLLGCDTWVLSHGRKCLKMNLSFNRKINSRTCHKSCWLELSYSFTTSQHMKHHVISKLSVLEELFSWLWRTATFLAMQCLRPTGGVESLGWCQLDE